MKSTTILPLPELLKLDSLLPPVSRTKSLDITESNGHKTRCKWDVGSYLKALTDSVIHVLQHLNEVSSDGDDSMINAPCCLRSHERHIVHPRHLPDENQAASPWPKKCLFFIPE